MANRFPLIFNSGAGQIQELAASDNLDLTSAQKKQIAAGFIKFKDASSL